MVLDEQVAAARESLRSRRLRDRIFVDYLEGFGGPSWDMLLRLFVDSDGGKRSIVVTTLLKEPSQVRAISKRYISWLESRDLIDLGDGDVTLTATGLNLMETYLTAKVQGD